MAGSPPFARENQVTLANWQDPPYNRWAFQHVRELVPSARIPRGDGFLVIHRGRIVAEQYFIGLRPDVPHLLMSVSKSVTGLVAGALAGQGRLDVTARAETIVPELAGTAFAGATVQDLLDMRTGIRFKEGHHRRRGRDRGGARGRVTARGYGPPARAG